MFRLLSTVLLLTFLGHCSSKIQCPIQGTTHALCVCTTGYIDCVGHSFSTIPIFSTISGNFRRLNLTNNRITDVPVNAFASLNNITEIDLSWNWINAIHQSAFGGVSDTLRVVNLAHNHLTTLSQPIQELTHLEELDVSWNPIPGYTPGHGHGSHGTDGLTDSVMRALGSNMRSFKFGDPTMTSWPQSLDHLNRLEHLTVAGVNIPYWPSRCFHGFEQTLKSLTIDNANIEAVPLGISTLTQLEILHLSHLDILSDGTKSHFGDDSLTSAPFQSLANTLLELSLDYDGLTTFPDSIKDLRKLQRLVLDGNNLQFISDEAITLLKKSNVSSLSLKDCNLKRIPGAISDLTNLVTLDFSMNKLRSIESTDLQNLYNLTSLVLDNNPLKYVSDDSLCGLGHLRVVSLYNTSLTEISAAFKNLRSLTQLSLIESKIDCTCDITWIKAWREKCQSEQKIEIEGDCETIDQKIMDYVNTRLENCPGYSEAYRSLSCGNTCPER